MVSHYQAIGQTGKVCKCESVEGRIIRVRWSRLSTHCLTNWWHVHGTTKWMIWMYGR